MANAGLDLFDVEYRVTLHEGNGALGFLAGVGVGLATRDLIGIVNKTPCLAPSDVRFEFEGLLEGHPE